MKPNSPIIFTQACNVHNVDDETDFAEIMIGQMGRFIKNTPLGCVVEIDGIAYQCYAPPWAYRTVEQGHNVE